MKQDPFDSNSASYHQLTPNVQEWQDPKSPVSRTRESNVAVPSLHSEFSDDVDSLELEDMVKYCLSKCKGNNVSAEKVNKHTCFSLEDPQPHYIYHMINLGLGIDKDEMAAEEPSAAVSDEILPFEEDEDASHMGEVD
ncbi:Heat shock protein HSP 90-beta [Pteropus alecto]|uniref:Heat shock protein HSP 90-beta n=1 Tax=Pteropus alecto TaxID=9402 RepID=L5KC41_PTEAL|nr:Heat shock protein HSP 90-beta [Pteropus alecto]